MDLIPLLRESPWMGPGWDKGGPVVSISDCGWLIILESKAWLV